MRLTSVLPAQLADVKKGITDEDIVALATDEANQPAVIWELADLQVSSILYFTLFGVSFTNKFMHSTMHASRIKGTVQYTAAAASHLPC